LFLCLEGTGVVNLDLVLRESIVRICGVPAEQITPESALEDLGVDSLAAAEIITDVEIRTGIELPMDVLRGLGTMRTVREVSAHLQAGVGRPSLHGEP
jgi:acyl carrier protein